MLEPSHRSRHGATRRRQLLTFLRLRHPRPTSVAALLLAAALAAGAQAPPTHDPEASARAAFAAGRWEAARDGYRRAASGGTLSVQGHLELATALGHLGEHRAALAVLLDAERAGAPAAQVAMRRLRTELALGDLDATFAALDAANQAGFSGLSLLDQDPALAPLRADGRFAAARAATAANLYPCEHDPAYRGFDFWLGEWDVVATGSRPGDPGVQVSHSSIRSILHGCVVLETWSGAGGLEGQSFNRWDRTSRRWRQTWVDSTGSELELSGELGPDGSLRLAGTSAAAGGGTVLHRLGFFPQPDGRVRQQWEQSRDDGATWAVVFDGTYSRRLAATATSASTATSPARSTTTAATGSAPTSPEAPQAAPVPPAASTTPP
jgi:hypothetical protein